MNYIILDESFTATSEEQMRAFADAYRLYVKGLEIADGNERHTQMMERAARKALGEHFDTAKKCYELIYG